MTNLLHRLRRTIKSLVVVTVTAVFSTVTLPEPVICDERSEGLRISHTDGVILGREFRGRLVFRSESGGSAQKRPAKLIPCKSADCEESTARAPVFQVGRGGHFRIKRNINTASSEFCRSGKIETHRYVAEPAYRVVAEGCDQTTIVLSEAWGINDFRKIEVICGDAG